MIVATEFELRPESAQNATEATFQDLLRGICRLGAVYVLVLDRPIPLRRPLNGLPAVSKVEQLGESGWAGLVSAVRRGFATAIVVEGQNPALLLEVSGYARARKRTAASEHVEQNWGTVLNDRLSERQRAVVFGHDWDPVFVFEIAIPGRE